MSRTKGTLRLDFKASQIRFPFLAFIQKLGIKTKVLIESFLAGGRGRPALKLPQIVYAKPVIQEALIATREGSVMALVGDYLLCDADGNEWPVSKQHFDCSYDIIGYENDGRIKSQGRSVNVEVIQLSDAISVPIRSNGATLLGRPGDWLIRYSSGDFGIVASHLFVRSYRLLE